MSEQSEGSGVIGMLSNLGKAYAIIVLLPIMIVGMFYLSPFFNLMLFALHSFESPEQRQVVEQGYYYSTHKNSISDYSEKMSDLQQKYDELGVEANDRRGEGYVPIMDRLDPLFDRLESENMLSMVFIGILGLIGLAIFLFICYTILWLAVQAYKFVMGNYIIKLAYIATCIVNIISMLNSMPLDSSIYFMSFRIDFLKILSVIFDLLFLAFAIFVAVGRRVNAANEERVEAERLEKRRAQARVNFQKRKVNTNLT